MASGTLAAFTPVLTPFVDELLLFQIDTNVANNI